MCNASDIFAGRTLRKPIDDTVSDPKHNVAQSDVSQLYRYGRKFGCHSVALIYPKTPQFQSPLRHEFDDAVGEPLTLWCFPFDMHQPSHSVEAITEKTR